MKWLDDHTLDLGDVIVDLETTAAMHERQSTEQRFILVKSRSMVERLVAHVAGRPVRALIDIGIFKGGSCVLYHHLFRSDRLVAIERNPAPVAALEAYLARRDLGGRIRTHYGVDQGDRGAIEAILARDVGDLPIDLVVDDASHLLHATRASFNALFPRLTPGGLYVIEDWGWAHWPGAWQARGGSAQFAGQPALSNLILQIVLCAATQCEAIAEVTIDGTTAVVRRGSGPLDASFDVRRGYLARGRVLSPM